MVVVVIVAYFIFTSSGVSPSSSPLIGTPVSSDVLSYLSGVQPATLGYIGPGAGSALTAVPANYTAGGLTLNGKPEFLYMGAEYCPYCASERWALIVALDQFGSFTGLQYMQSSSSDIYPSTSTFTFLHANYTSNYISFVPVETEDRSENPLQTPTAAETALENTFDTGPNGPSIPFLDIGNKYTLVGSQVNPPNLRVGQSATGAPYNWTQIGSQLNNQSNIFAQSIDGAANRLIGAICAVDGSQPTSICTNAITPTVTATDSYVVHPSAVSQPLVSDATLVVPQNPAMPSRYSSTQTSWV